MIISDPRRSLQPRFSFAHHKTVHSVYYPCILPFTWPEKPRFLILEGHKRRDNRVFKGSAL